LLRKLHEFLQ